MNFSVAQTYQIIETGELLCLEQGYSSWYYTKLLKNMKFLSARGINGTHKLLYLDKDCGWKTYFLEHSYPLISIYLIPSFRDMEHIV